MLSNNKKPVKRAGLLHEVAQEALWDVLIVGGGATGLGAAVDAASRGYKTLLLEQADFAKGTSSRSTKLVHGGVRYLAQGNISLVYDALRERGLLRENAPHLVKAQSFIIPCYSWFALLKYFIGLTIYDWMAGRYSFGRSKYLSTEDVIKAMPEINEKGLKGGIEYFDGQFDDARLAIDLATTSLEHDGILLNYMKVTGLTKDANGKVNGVVATELEQGKEYRIRAKAVINATGVFVDDILRLDTPSRKPLVRPSQGVHVVLDRSFLNSDHALMIPQTSDGRVLFAVPWHNHVLVGTTDTPLDEHSPEPRALDAEINFILSTAGKYLDRIPRKSDVLSVFAGLRPLAYPEKNTSSTKEISRDHKLMVSESGLITITGGKWTTYRKMAEEVINKAVSVGTLHLAPCVTRTLHIHGYTATPKDNSLGVYGADEAQLRELMKEVPAYAEKLHPDFPYTKAQVIWAARYEMARTVEDVLARRLRILFLNAAAAQEMATATASLLAQELGRNEAWEQAQVEAFGMLAAQYILTSQRSSRTGEENQNHSYLSNAI
ncbi:glycerol-3-phosphate dehydrogenase/oxidase [Fulvivirgaceae bacterium PWU4]|uniref:Glycerol-3-phosphate dehydrogenase/oxidase n=1 Tax=Chryseosolibacter histidini TaxID=2782349 RepID=A0AAP2DHF4_9BACT|nr:glycerol-3-phosphate dehydrogenase/oxidase [Chryseosolibacter histidini]MBT1695252.1 glycerol-3-phosphate dehydrogenase/oxidase [Chryseosolibacter histidini]